MPNYRRACIIGALASLALAIITTAIFGLIIAGTTASAMAAIIAPSLLIALGGAISAATIWAILDFRLLPDDRAQHKKAEEGGGHDSHEKAE